jgi:hypothetical protein
MKHELAFMLIGKLLDWTDAEFATEFRELQLMIDYKYDAYQGFQPATRFHVALLNWLSQFSSINDKKTAYQFVKKRLLFVSQREMNHLVSLMMPLIDNLMHGLIADELKISRYMTWIDPTAKTRLDLLRRRTLYVGLSDGARIDVFRRYNEGRVSNEQVVAYSEISDKKWEDLQKELRKSLKEQIKEGDGDMFELVCLVDDFSGSGSSLIRKDENGNWKGKIPKFFEVNADKRGKLLMPNCRVHVHHHLASSKAENQIKSDLKAFCAEHTEFECTTSYSSVLTSEIVIDDGYVDQAFVALVKACYDNEIEDDHTGKDIWYGYKQCGLPLVLEHNTPNNSVALLWATSPNDNHKPQMKPLFARRKRHSSNG